MANMTADDFVNWARADVGGPSTTQVTDARILRLVNQSYILNVCAVYPLRELDASTSITTASGTAEYTLSVSDVLRITAIEDQTNYLNITPFEIDRRHYHSLVQGNASGTTGQPTHWFISGVGTSNRPQITFYPTPAGTYNIGVFHQKKPDEIVQSPTATTTILPYQWDDVIHQFTVSKLWRTLGDLAKYRAIKGEALELAQAALVASARSDLVAMALPGFDLDMG